MTARLFIILCLFAGSSAQAASARQKLVDFLTGLDTLKARFTQQVSQLDSNQISHDQGMFYLSRPDHFRWVYEGEYPRYIVADGRTIWLVEEDIQQVSQRSQKSALKGTPAGLLVGAGVDIDREFKVEELGERMGLSWLKLIPKDKDAQFQSIIIAFEGKQLYRMEMADQYGQVTRFDFFDMQRNIPLAKDLFKFIPPPGYDILDQ